MDLSEWFPNYPALDNATFADHLFRKREFNELQMHEPQQHAWMLNHQTFVSRFLGPSTPYRELLYFATMGSGKTYAAIGTAETLMRHPESVLRRTLILVSNTHFQSKYYTDIANIVPDLYRVDGDAMELPMTREKTRRRRERARISQHYAIHTYETFFNTYRNGLQWAVQEYEGHFLVLDEVHHIVHAEHYAFYVAFLNALRIRKILLLTATPMRDHVSDMAYLMNLIVGGDVAPLCVDDAFVSAYFTSGSAILSNSALDRALRGRVAYVKTSSQMARSTYVGVSIGHLTVFPVVMGGQQLRVYRDVDEHDRGAVDTHVVQAALLVFPDGSIGDTGYRTYCAPDSNLLRQHLRNAPDPLVALQDMSTKYAHLVRYILGNPTKKIFVFNASVREGGCIALTHILHAFNIRHAFVSSMLQTADAMKARIAAFNDDLTNAHGQCIQVLIGSVQLSEGYTFRNVHAVHVLTAHWNCALLRQAVGRAVRHCSHTDPTTVVELYLYAAVTPMPDETSVDMRMYHMAQHKQDLMDTMERHIAACAVDSRVNATLHATLPMIVDTPLDERTYQLYHTDANVGASDLRDQWMTTLEKRDVVHLPPIRSLGIGRAIHQLVYGPTRMRLTDDMTIHMDASNNVLYTNVHTYSTSMHDSTFRDVSGEPTFAQILDTCCAERVQHQLDALAQCTPDRIQDLEGALPTDMRYQLLEDAVMRRMWESQLSSVDRHVLAVWKQYVHAIPSAFHQTVYVTCRAGDDNVIRMLDTTTSEWTSGDCAVYEPHVVSYLGLIERAVDMGMPYYVRYSQTGRGNLVAVDAAKRKTWRGVSCESLSLHALQALWNTVCRVIGRGGVTPEKKSLLIEDIVRMLVEDVQLVVYV